MSVKHHFKIAHVTDCHDTNPEGGELAATEVEFAYSDLVDEYELPVRKIKVVPAEEFNSIDVGAKFSKLVTSSRDPKTLIVAVNAAPPSIIGGGKDGNERTNFVLGRLKTGVTFGGTWGGHSLSYIKSQIAELYELVDSNDSGTQFRSLEVLPEALVQYATDRIDPKRIELFDINRIAEIPAQSHAWTIDNFKNTKVILSNGDRQQLQTMFAPYIDEIKRARTENERLSLFDKLPKIGVGFDGRSIEFARRDNQPTSIPEFANAALSDSMFRGRLGHNIFSLTCSARRFSETGELVPVAQVATLRDEPHQPIAYTLPRIGAQLRFAVGGHG